MFQGINTSAEESQVQTSRIVSNAVGAVMSQAPALAAMRETALSGLPTQPEKLESGDETGYWIVGMAVGSAPLEP
jgi:hypothetical protein